MINERTIALKQHRYVCQENKAEYADAADFDDVDCRSIASKAAMALANPTILLANRAIQTSS